ncbi:hypothetical protein ACFL6T_02165 [Candidatus Zixiibacteriota bacterium]
MHQIDIRHVEARIHEYLSRLANLNASTSHNEPFRQSVLANLRQYSRIDLKRILVVAFVQRETDQAVLQTAVIDLRP